MKEGARSSPGTLFRRRALISTHLSYRRKFTAHRGPQFPQQKGTVQSVGGGGRLSQFNKICKHLCLGAQSCPTLCDPWTVAHQAPLSMEVSRQEYWSGLPCPPPGVVPSPGMEPGSVSWIPSGCFTIWATKEAHEHWNGQPIPSPGDLSNPGIQPGSPAL